MGDGVEQQHPEPESDRRAAERSSVAWRTLLHDSCLHAASQYVPSRMQRSSDASGTDRIKRTAQGKTDTLQNDYTMGHFMYTQQCSRNLVLFARVRIGSAKMSLRVP